MRPRTIRQHVLPDWLLRGFARGTGEAGETTWCHTADRVAATTLGLAGSYEDHRDDPVPKMLVRSLDEKKKALEAVIGLLRGREPGEFVDKPPIATYLLAELGLRIYSVQIVATKISLLRMREIASLMKTVDSMPDWATALVEDVERYGLDAVVQAICSRRPTKPHARSASEPRYAGSNKTIIKFWKAIDDAADEAHFQVKLPDVTKLHDRWKRKLARARYRVIERAPGSVILGDVGMLVRYKGKAGLHPFDFEELAGVVAVLLPISSSQVVVASVDRNFDPAGTPTNQINRATARWSLDFFVASRRSLDQERLRAVLAAGWETWDAEETG